MVASRPISQLKPLHSGASCVEYPVFKITQSESFGSFQKAAGREVYSFKTISGVSVLFIKFKLPLRKCRLLGMGVDFSVFAESDFQNLMNEARAMGCTHIRCEGYGGALPTNLRVSKVEKPYLPMYTIKVDLKPDHETLLSQMKRKGRYNITVAQKENVEIECFYGLDSDGDISKALDEFYSVLKETGKRDKFGIHPKEYYLKMLNALGENALLYIARSGGRAIAGIIVIYGKDEAVYYYGASSNEYRNLMAPYLLQWHAMKDAKAEGKTMYDFMGTARPTAALPLRGDDNGRHGGAAESGGFHQGMSAKDIEFCESDPLYGVSEFKQKFGGRLYKFQGPVDLVINLAFYRLFKLGKRFFVK